MEGLKPIENNKISIIRLFADLQVCSTYRKLKKMLPKTGNGGACLDVGCGDSPYKFMLKGYDYKGIDWEGSDDSFGYKKDNVEYYDGETFPIEENSIDLLIHTEVAEHIPDILLFFNECARVLKKDGIMVFSIPFSARYHYIPNDFRRLTPAGIEQILKQAGFSAIEIEPRSTDITVACYKVVTVGYRWLLSRKIYKVMGFILLLPVFAISLLLGQLALWLDIGDHNDCLGYVVRTKKGI